MGPAFFVMAILGCGEASDACQPVTTVPVRYESAAECNAATEDQIAKHSDVMFPVVVAQCRPANTPAAQQIWSDEVKLPEGQSSSGARIQQASLKADRPRG